jgi:hypothetical protein
MIRTVLSRAIPAVLGLLVSAAIAPFLDAQSIGLVLDVSTDRAVLFDADSLQSLGSVQLPAVGACSGDCVIDEDQQLAYVSGTGSEIHVIDVSTRPPTLAAGINPIPISKPGTDLDLTPDGLYLVVGGQWVMTVDTVTRTEVATHNPFVIAVGIDASIEGTVLLTLPTSLALRRLILASDGSMTDSGDNINVLESWDVEVAPGAIAGVAGSTLLRSFVTPPLTLVDTRTLSEGARSLALNPAGTRVYLRQLSGLEAYTLDPATGHLGAEALFRVPLPYRECQSDGLVFHPDGTKLFVVEDEQVLALDPHDGHLVGRVTDAGIVAPRAMHVRAGPEAF